MRVRRAPALLLFLSALFLAGCPGPEEDPTPTYPPEDVTLPPYDACGGVTCSGHGTCSAPNDIPVCSCEQGYEPQGTNCRPSTEGGQSWTFLVYMSADNDLEEFAVGDLEEMMEVGSTSQVNLVVVSDRSTDYDDSPVGSMANWTNTRILKVEDGSLTQLKDLGEKDMGDPATLADFIEYAVDAFPADRFALDFWNHGGSWYGFGWDEGNDYDALTLQELADGIKEGLSRTSLAYFDLLGFDACLMASMEVIETVEPFGRYYAASEETEPGHGWDYRALSALTAKPTMDGATLGKAILDGYVEQAAEWETTDSLTFSIMDLTVLPTLRKALYDAATELNGKMATYSPAIVESHKETPAYGQASTPEESINIVDFRTVLDGVASRATTFKTAFTAVAAAVDSMVLYNHFGPNQEGSTGLAIYFPALYNYYDKAYNDVPKMDVWRSVLTTFWRVGLDDNTSPVFTNPDGEADVKALTSPWLEVSGHLDPATTKDLYSTTFSFSVVDGSLEYFLGDEDADFDKSSSMVTHEWDTSALVVSQAGDADATFAYYIYTSSSADSSLTLTIPMAYFEAGEANSDPQWAEWVISKDKESGETTGSIYMLYGEEGAVGELRPEPGSEFIPLVYIYDNDNPDDSSWYYLDNPPFDATLPITQEFYYLPEDLTFAVYLFADDIAGNSDMVWATIE